MNGVSPLAQARGFWRARFAPEPRGGPASALLPASPGRALGLLEDAHAQELRRLARRRVKVDVFSFQEAQNTLGPPARCPFSATFWGFWVPLLR